MACDACVVENAVIGRAQIESDPIAGPAMMLDIVSSSPVPGWRISISSVSPLK